MPSVKLPKLFGLFLPAAGWLVTGCSSDDLARLAPPGIIKYENLAGDGEPNPEIQQQIKDRKEDSGTRFPKLYQEPSDANWPDRKSSEEVGKEMDFLARKRDEVEAGVIQDRANAEEDIQIAAELADDRDTLIEAIGEDTEAALNERQDTPTPKN